MEMVRGKLSSFLNVLQTEYLWMFGALVFVCMSNLDTKGQENNFFPASQVMKLLALYYQNELRVESVMKRCSLPVNDVLDVVVHTLVISSSVRLDVKCDLGKHVEGHTPHWFLFIILLPLKNSYHTLHLQMTMAKLTYNQHSDT